MTREHHPSATRGETDRNWDSADHHSTEVTRIAISNLVPADSPRLAGENAEHVNLLAESEEELPPIIVHRETMRVIDGMHRLHAARARGQREIDVRFFTGNAHDAFVLAVQANISHGLPLSFAERAAAARRIMSSHPHWSDRAVGRVTGISAKSVASIRAKTPGGRQLAHRVGLDGRERPLNTAEGRRRAAEFIRQHPGLSLRQVAQAAGISVSTVLDVRRRLKCGEDPVLPSQRTSCTSWQGSAAAPPAEPRPGRAPEEADDRPRMSAATILRNLQNDPSLRFSGPGRLLLRLFHLTLASDVEWPTVAETIPAHQANVIAHLAEDCVRHWQHLAEQAKSRVLPDTASGLPAPR
ncbi:ParB/RepB/Spo0J family partition protein [Saccharopolyspora sp. NPDC000359]|uniref:ParB/RepB/Spo0J family partition protein n=1 Tax=Saccharopolyspora sp. NPDC000359 TaxID=3154251 RepID=UPI00332E3012